MSKANLETRVAALENEVARLKDLVGSENKTGWKSFVGLFSGDPSFEEAMKLGRQYRESTRPKPRRKKRSNNART
jgi:hypothetical protein